VRYARNPERRLVCSTSCITAAFDSAGTRDKSSSLKSYGITRSVFDEEQKLGTLVTFYRTRGSINEHRNIRH
jgi:hypothetical protein